MLLELASAPKRIVCLYCSLRAEQASTPDSERLLHLQNKANLTEELLFKPGKGKKMIHAVQQRSLRWKVLDLWV